MQSTLDQVIQEVLALMPMSIDIYAVEVVDGNYKCYCLNTYYLTVNSRITLNSVDYKVESFAQDEYLILSGSVSPPLNIYSIPNLTYKWGRFNQVNVELGKKNDIDIMPMLWRFDLEPRTDLSLTDSINNSEGSTRLFFINTTDIEAYTTEVDYNNVLNPMQGYIRSFLSYLKRHRLVGKLGTSVQIKHPKFLIGGNSVGKDESKYVFNKKISAIELTISLPIRKDLTCQTKFIPVVEGKSFGSAFNSDAFN